MSNILIINAHQPYPFAEGRLNRSLASLAQEVLASRCHDVRSIETHSGYDVEQEIENHLWADVVILQTPVNWMGVPWSFKKYMDEVYTAGMDGRLTRFDGRTEEEPKRNYGNGGTLTDTRYMISLTFNAPEEAFNDKDEYLFQGKGVDDLLFPMHMNFRFFGMQQVETFACFDVMKNSNIENDFRRYTEHLEKHF